MRIKNKQQPPQLPSQLKMPEVPRAFISHAKVKHVLCDTVEDFGFEEQEALYFYCFLNLPISEISKSTGLSHNHVVSVLCLYSERLSTKLSIFKKALPYDANDLLPISEILLPEPSDDIV